MKHKAIYEGPDLSQEPTRKVDAMSSLAAEMLLTDADATSPGIPALNVDRALADAARSEAARVGPAPRVTERQSGTIPILPRATSPAEESAMLRALRPKGPRVLLALALLSLARALGAAAIVFSS